MKKFLFDCGTRDATASFGIFVLRVLVSLMMLIGHGIPKLLHYGTLKDVFYVPDFFPFYFMSSPMTLMLVIIAEVVVPLFLIVGLMTRPAAFVLGFSMVVAVFGQMAGAPWFISPPTVMIAKELGLLYLIPVMVIIFTGAGAISLDAGLYRDSKRRRW